MASFADLWSGLNLPASHPPYLLVDCAGLPGGERELPRDGFSQLQCLFAGELAVELADVAPYLARLASPGPEGPGVAEALMKRQVGTLVVPSSTGEALSFQQMHRHFRKFNVVYGPEGKPLFFRYYDPRLLFQVLSVLEPRQLEAFFGPVERFVVSDGERALQCWRQDDRLVMEER